MSDAFARLHRNMEARSISIVRSARGGLWLAGIAALISAQPVRFWWTRLQPIRTVAEIELEFMVFAGEPFAFQRIAGEARRMRALGMTLQAIGAAFGVDEKTVRKALARSGS